VFVDVAIIGVVRLSLHIPSGLKRDAQVSGVFPISFSVFVGLFLQVYVPDRLRQIVSEYGTLWALLVNMGSCHNAAKVITSRHGRHPEAGGLARPSPLLGAAGDQQEICPVNQDRERASRSTKTGYEAPVPDEARSRLDAFRGGSFFLR